MPAIRYYLLWRNNVYNNWHIGLRHKSIAATIVARAAVVILFSIKTM